MMITAAAAIPALIRFGQWFLAGGWRYAAAAAAVIGTLSLGYGIWKNGYDTAEAKCETAALQAQIAKLNLELTTAKQLAESAQATAAALQAQDQKAQERQRELQGEIDSLRQAPRKDGKPAPNALVTPRCDLTRRGVRFFTR